MEPTSMDPTSIDPTSKEMDELRPPNDLFDESVDEAAVMFTRRWLADDACSLEIRGDLDIAISGLLRHELDELLALDIGRLDIDLSGVLFMDSSALSALVQANETAHRRNQQFNLLHPSPACMKVLTITGLDRVFGLS
jgi:anti-sigma B factor antagonist